MLKCGLIHFCGERDLRGVHLELGRQLGFEPDDELASNAIVELLYVFLHCCY